MSRPTIIATAAVLAFVAGCGTDGTSSPRPSSTSPPVSSTTTLVTLSGIVTAGPTCPVERSDQPCPERPVAGAVVATNGSDREVGSAVIDAAGRYALRLADGAYTLRVRTLGQFPTCPATAVDVSGVSHADISCDTGIR